MELDTAAVARDYEATVRARFGGQLPAALALRDRLDPQRWVLEWHLPWWVGRAYGLEPGTCHELVTSNVLGLAALLVADDVLDGEASAGANSHAADALYQAALEPYHARFSPDSPFWPELDRLMAAWRAATAAPDPSAARDPEACPTPADRLARRGAPLKASAFAVCLLADRPHDYPALAATIDHALAGLVLYDHLADWPADLAAGRANAFVAHALGPASSPSTDSAAATQESEVRRALLVGGVVPAYVGRIRAELGTAASSAEALGIGALANHLRNLDERIGSDGLALEAHYERLSRRSTVLLFGDRAAGSAANE